MSYPIRERIKHILDKEFFVDDRALFMKLQSVMREIEPYFLEEVDTECISTLTEKFSKSIGLQSEYFIPTGFRDVDKELYGGLALGEFVVIGGRPGMGKAGLLTQLALNISEKIPCLFFSLDLGKMGLMDRLLWYITKFDISRIRGRYLTEDYLAKEELEMLESYYEKLANHHLFISTLSNASLSMFRRECEKYIKEKGVKVIFVDNLQLMAFSRKWGNRELEIASICKELKSIARDCNVSVVVSSQLSRSVEMYPSKRPQLSHLRESGSIEEIADKVMFIYRPEYYKIETWEDDTISAGQAVLIVAKNKTGAVADIRIRFRNGRFGDLNISDEYETMDRFIFNKKRLDEIKDDDDFPF